MRAAVPALEEAARAKINLALHVTGRRGDGYHLLDSLVVFTALGDRLSAAPDEDLTLTIEGPMAASLAASDNLVMKAAEALARVAGHPRAGARMVLDKQLPVAAGIGGGSADAAAALRLLSRLWGLRLDHDRLCHLGAVLGADVPVCVGSRAARMRGIGDRIDALGGLPALPLVLVNPGIALATPAVFAGLQRRDNDGLPEMPGAFADAAEVAAWLEACRNDLEAAAVELAPPIAAVLEALAATPGCLLARMSGSGATCFAIYASSDEAEAGAAAMGAARPDWWCRATTA